MKVDVVLDDAKLRNLPQTLRTRSRQLIQRTVLQIEGEAKVRAPVDTGALRSSISTRMESDVLGEVNVGMEYAAHVEYGTVHQAAHPYLTPAVEAVRPLWDQGLKDLFNV